MNGAFDKAAAGMTLGEALRIVQNAASHGPPYRAVLACGCTPLHLHTFLAACLQRNLPERKVMVVAGLYGDLAGTIETIDFADKHALAVALEWSDFDPRLGFRSAGKWGPAATPDMVGSALAAMERIAAALERLPAGISVAMSLPAAPLPPLFHCPSWQYAEAELELACAISHFAARVAKRSGLLLVNPARLAVDSPPAGRFDLEAELVVGFPYTVAHASALAEAFARLFTPPAPKKGLITDLDDTLWHGLAGELGPQEVSWDLASHSHAHGLYQKLLAALAEEGVLLAAASKNDPAVVRQVFERGDLLLSAERMFPMEVHWQPKSGSVSRILRTWNISADSAVFVDDSPMELAEVAAAHPGLECVLFPKGGGRAVLATLWRLRDLFGKPRLSGEDAIRLDSIRRFDAVRQSAADGASVETFLQHADSEICLDFDLSGSDPRELELVNKTNQFNLNGIRFGEADWRTRLAEPGAILASVTYRDKFGPLGKIAVLQGRQEGPVLRIGVWVMSCRAFSRRIEHYCLKSLFERFGSRELFFEFAPTSKNGPLQDFFAQFLGGRPAAAFALSRERFQSACPPLFHRATSWEKVQADG